MAKGIYIKNIIRAIMFAVFAAFYTSGWAQGYNTISNSKPNSVDSLNSAIFTKYIKSLQEINQRFHSWEYTGSDTLSCPDYFPIFTPPTLYGEITNSWIGKKGIRIKPSNKREIRKRAIEQQLIDIYTKNPQYVILYNENADSKSSLVLKETKPIYTPPIQKGKKVEEPKIEENEDLDDLWKVEVQKPNFWQFETTSSLHFTQYYVSDNWYQGGESNITMLASIIVDANFDNKQKLIFNNKLEMKLGFQTSKDDTKRKLRTSTDLIRMTNKLGWKAAKNWYYTTTLQTWTQFYPAYKKNDDKVYSDFLSPFEGLLTVGMDFSLNKKRGSLNLSLSPLACNYKYVDRLALSPSFGLKEGHHSRFNLGSNVTVNYNWNIWKNLSWKGRIYYFTDYHRTQVEWENTFNFKVNEFLSTKIFLYPRFDDGVARVDNNSYFQFHELVSVGFDYTF